MNLDASLIQACTNGNADAITRLLINGADIDAGDVKTPLYTVIHRDDPNLVSLLIEYGANVNQRGFYNDTPLTYGAKIWGNPKIIESLLIGGANIDDQGYQGFTALHHAVDRNNIELVRLLIDYQANPFITDISDKTAVDYANDDIRPILTNYMLDYANS